MIKCIEFLDRQNEVYMKEQRVRNAQTVFLILTGIVLGGFIGIAEGYRLYHWFLRTVLRTG